MTCPPVEMQVESQENCATNILEIDRNGSELNPKKAFKIKPHKGVQLTESIKKDLKNKNDCLLDSLHEAYICPLGEKENVDKFLKEQGIKADLIEVTDFYPNRDKKINKFENQIEFHQKKITKDELNLLVDVNKYDKQKSTSDFFEPPSIDNFLENESDDRKKARLDIEIGFHKRYLSIEEDKQTLQNLRTSLENRKVELQKIQNRKSKKLTPEERSKIIIEEDELEDYGSEGNAKELTKATASARRRALSYQFTHNEIINDICKQFPTLKDKSDEIASKSLLWAEKYQTECDVIFNGIPKKITDMQSLDSRFAQLEAPGQPCVTIHRADAQPISNIDFTKRLSGEVIITGVDDKGQPKHLDAKKYWEGNSNKHIYRNIVFTNKSVGNETYNLFTGFGVKPKKGNCERIFNHIKEVICAGDEINNTAFLKLLAWQIQNIGKPSRIITALKSKAQQVGKGCLLADVLAVIYGNSGFVTSDLGQIITRFNDTIRGKAFIFLDEALFSGDRKAADAIKSLATATRQGVESKGIPTVQFPIAVNLFLATNHDDAAHGEESDARYWILEASPHCSGNTKYFNDLYQEIERGGREAFMHYLLNLDVKDFVPSRDVPKDNEFKDAMIRNSINPYDARKWLEECCYSRMILGLKPIDKEVKHPSEPWETGSKYENGLFFTAYTEWQKTVKSPVAPKPTSIKKCGELLNNAGFEMHRTATQKYRALPDPDECLKTLTEMIEKLGK